MHSDMYHIAYDSCRHTGLVISARFDFLDRFRHVLLLNPFEAEAAPRGVAPMLLYIQAVSYLHINGPLPDSPERSGHLALCSPYKIFRQYIQLIYILTGRIDSVLKVSKHNAGRFKCESTQA